MLNRVSSPLEQLPDVVELPVAGQQPRRRADAIRNHERVLCTAARLFEQRGPQNVSMELIAAEAGVGKGTIEGPHEDIAGNTKVGLALETVIDRTKFGLNWNAPLPKGGFALADDVKLTVELELAKA